MDASLPSLFRSHRNRQFLLVRPGGNYGDRLIWWGGERLCDRLGIRWESVPFEAFRPREVDPDTVVYLHGSGGFNPWCSGRAARSLTAAVLNHSGLVIQGPQTFEDDPSYARDVFASWESGEIRASRVVVYCREQVTYDLLRDHAPEVAEVRLGPDTAFYVSREDITDLCGEVRGKYRLCCLREDAEAPRDGPPREAHRGVCLDPAMFARSFEHWLRLHAGAETILSNRLHSAILGSLLEIPTRTMKGAYHKNRSVWEFSLEERGVGWGREPGAGADRAGWVDRAVSAVSRSLGPDRLPARLLNRLRGVPLG